MRIAPTFPELCRIARRVHVAETPTLYADWSEGIKCRIAKERRAYPTPEQITRAMYAVERAIAKATPAPRPPTPRPDPPAPLTQAEAIAALREIQRRAGITPTIRTVPYARPRTPRQIIAARKLGIVMQAIADVAANQTPEDPQP